MNVYEFITGNKKSDFYTEDDMFLVDYDMELLRFWYDTDVVIDEGMADYRCTARRPYYQMRGRRITEQQAFEIIRRTDMYAPWEKCRDCNDYVDSMNFQNWWTSPHLPAYYGWIHPNGIVGSDAVTQKFANVKEFVEEWINYIYRFPFLDLVIAVSRWNELPQYAWDDFKTYMFEPYIDFLDNIEAGIWVHDGTLEIMSPARTVKKYKEYEENTAKRITGYTALNIIPSCVLMR